MLFRAACLAVALALAAPVSLGQDGKGDPGVKRPGAPEIRLQLPLTGLTADNVERVEKALATLTARGFACPQCHKARLEAGDCKKCAVALQPGQVPLLEGIEVAAAEGQARATVARVAPVRLSDLETALRRAGVSIDGKKLTLPAPATLVFRGGAGGENVAPRVQRALLDAKLYGGVRAVLNESNGEVWVHVSKGATKAPLRSAVASAVASQSDLPQFADVVWGAPEPKAAPAKGDGKRKKGEGKKQGEGKKGRKQEGGGRR